MKRLIQRQFDGFLTVKRQQAGFTLIEVLVAVAIIGIGLTALLGAFSQGLEALNTTQSYSTALILCRGKLAEVVNGVETKTSGSFEKPYTLYTWEKKSDSADNGLNRITVYVKWPQGEREKRVSLSTLNAGGR